MFGVCYTRSAPGSTIPQQRWARVRGSGIRVQGSGFKVQISGFRVQGSGLGAQGSGFRVRGSGSRVQDCYKGLLRSEVWVAPWGTTLELMGNYKSQFLGIQGEYMPKIEISGPGVPILHSTSWIAFYNCSAQNQWWRCTQASSVRWRVRV